MKAPHILILAAGEGTRMKSSLPKVLHRAAGDTLLGHVLRAARPVSSSIGVVVGRGAEAVETEVEKTAPSVKFFVQKQRLGSGHAVMSAKAWIAQAGGDVVVLCGDAPLIQTDTLKALVERHRREGNSVTLLTAWVPQPRGYGRVVRNADGAPTAIVEEKDANEFQRKIKEINSGAYCFAAKDLAEVLSQLRPNNAKGEYYITDAVALLIAAGKKTGAVCADSAEEVLGVNHRGELAAADKILRERRLLGLMQSGVTIMDPASTYIEPGVTVGEDATIWPQTFLSGKTSVGKNAVIGPMCSLDNAKVGDGAHVHATFAQDAVIGPKAHVGPFAHLRPGAVIGAGAKVGNFVEIKKSKLGAGAKANHLAYIGDAVLGDNVNVGAGVITCNYDGFQKFQTRVGAGAFIGSNANLVAPVTIGAGAVIGAGSTITRNVPADALALERSTQMVKKNWAAERRKKMQRIVKKKKHS